MTPDFTRDHFDLFGLAAAFAVDEAALDRAYRDVQAQVHPDRFAHLSDAEKRLSLQWATRVNEAYRTLKNPLARAEYLLQRQGIDPGFESNTAMTPAFLMEQMEWREAVEEARQARNAAALDALHGEVGDKARALVEDLRVALDERQALDAARELVRKMKFLEKLRDDINDALEALEN